MLATAGVFAIADMKLNGVEVLRPAAVRPAALPSAPYSRW